MSTAAFIRRCLSVGMDLEIALLAAEQFEAKPKPMAPALTSQTRGEAAEKKRQRDRERMAAKREAERVARRSQNGRSGKTNKINGVAEVAGDVAATVAGDTRDQDGDSRRDTSCARVGDNNPNLDTTGSVGGGVGVERERDQSDEWPADPWQALVEAADSPWLDPQKSLSLVTTAGRVEAWKRRGASWSRHVLPVVTALAKQHGAPISSWQFFEPAIGRAIQASRAEMELPDVVVPFRSTGPPSLTDRIAAEHAEARRRVLES